ncbi:hypothetical protein J6590_097262 [Homalodisca vitripennis]|nr:hypothetical protein J6590_097262 [Homalodisca vitripennis]
MQTKWPLNHHLTELEAVMSLLELDSREILALPALVTDSRQLEYWSPELRRQAYIICVSDGVGHTAKHGERPDDDNDDMANERKTTPLPATQFAAKMPQPLVPVYCPMITIFHTHKTLNSFNSAHG